MKKAELGQTEALRLKEILDRSLGEKDMRATQSLQGLKAMAMETDEALMMLAQYKSKVKYGYHISPESLSYVMALARTGDRDNPVSTLVESPFLLAKACWLYEHAPYFFFMDGKRPEDTDFVVRDFAQKYKSQYLDSHVDLTRWEKMKRPRRLLVSTFWERRIFDPLQLIEKVRHKNIEGLELNVDFHPFNYTTLLPEELGKSKREQIREAAERIGVKIDIHSPIVGPYTPSPDPAKGKQLFFDPTNCLQIQLETIDLAKDMGARSVVVHLIDTSELKPLVGLVEKAGGTGVRITIENYTYTEKRQTADVFIECLQEMTAAMPREVKEKNFGVTLDVGHLNIEGEDPIVGAEKIGKWCLGNGVFLRLHATDNYGDLLFSPPAYSADVHGNVSGRGINNGVVIKLLRSMGHEFDVVAEQIHPLTPDDIETIHGAQSCLLEASYESYVSRGRKRLAGGELKGLVEQKVLEEEAYQFLAGIEGTTALREYLVYRRIQDKKHLSVDEAKKISQDFMRMPQRLKADLTAYIDDLLLPVRTESGIIQKNELDLICQNISGALYATINNEHLNQIFAQDRNYRKGDTICEQGTPGHEMYFVKEGEVTVLINDSSVATLGPGEIFGEISLFYNVNRSATVKAAAQKTIVGVLSRGGLEALFRSGEPYARDLIYRLYNTLPERLRNLNDKYKSIIRTLHYIWKGGEQSVPNPDVEMEIKRQKSDFVPTLSESEAKAMCEEVRSFSAGQPVFSEGDGGDGAYFILEGRVKAVRLSEQSGEVLLGELGVGEMFGEMALVDEKPRSASVIAISPCQLAFIGKKAFDQLMETRSDLAFRLMSFICLSIFRRILRLDRLYSEMHKPRQSRRP